MEEVHKSNYRHWISECYDVREFLNEWNSLLSDYESTFRDVEQLQDPSYSKEFLEASEDNDSSLLTCNGESQIELSANFICPSEVDLQCVKKQKIEVDKRVCDVRYKTFMYNNYRSHSFPHYQDDSKVSNSSCSSNTVDLPEVRLTVQVFRPEISLRRYTNVMPARIPVFTVEHEFNVLGCQYLTELRDKLSCISDEAIPGEFSENPHEETNIKCGDLMKSGFFYINGVFYNDMRDGNALDYSKTIIDWTESSDRGIGPFTSEKMEEAKFIELKLKLGYPYVYLHQGYCEHLLVFSDMRILSQSDSLDLNSYPLINKFITRKRDLCMACLTYVVKWVVTDNPRLPERIYFFCEKCFYKFNYDQHGQKIGQFEARKYFDRTVQL